VLTTIRLDTRPQYETFTYDESGEKTKKIRISWGRDILMAPAVLRAFCGGHRCGKASDIVEGQRQFFK